MSMFDDLKERATQTAFRAMQSDTARKVVADERFQKAVAGALKAGMQIREEAIRAKASVERFAENRNPEDDLTAMKRKLDRAAGRE